MPSKKKALKSYCSEEEIKAITEQAVRSGLSVSEFIKKVCTGYVVPSREDSQAQRELLRINADIARLGGLFKMALSNGVEKDSIIRMLLEIDERQKELKEAIKKI